MGMVVHTYNPSKGGGGFKASLGNTHLNKIVETAEVVAQWSWIQSLLPPNKVANPAGSNSKSPSLSLPRAEITSMCHWVQLIEKWN